MQEKSRELEETVKSRKEFFGPGVLDICKAADMVFLALHGSNGEDGKVQSVFDLMGIPYTGSGSAEQRNGHGQGNHENGI